MHSAGLIVTASSNGEHETLCSGLIMKARIDARNTYGGTVLYATYTNIDLMEVRSTASTERRIIHEQGALCRVLTGGHRLLKTSA